MDFADVLALADQDALEHLGRSVTYTPTVGSAASVRGVFDENYVRVDLGQAGVASSGPAVWLAVADLPSNPKSDRTATVTVGAITYRFREIEPDGQGGVLLHLFKV